MTAPGRKRVGVMISGGGSNMAALIAAAGAPDYPAEIVAVVSNRPDAGGLAKADAAGVPAIALDHRAFAGREAFEAAVDIELTRRGVEILCLAGFMRLLTPWFVRRWQDRMLNIHPALLPAYPGLHTHARALADGVKLAGCTVHFVREAMDTGPVVGQAAVPVLSGDTAETLSARVLAAEHRLYPRALALVASGRATVERRADGSDYVRIEGEAADAGEAFIWP